MTLTGSTPAGRAVAAQGGRAAQEDACSSSAAATRTSCWRTPTSTPPPRSARRRGSSTAGRAASPPSASSWSSRCSARFEERLVERMQARRMGDPLDDGDGGRPAGAARPARRAPPPGPREPREGRARAARRRGARGTRRLLPADRPRRRAPGMPAFDEELFGPVAAVIAAQGRGRTRSGSRTTRVFGLGAAVFTADRARGERIARQELEAGSCFVNAFVRSDPRLPFGGIKESGYGRELAGLRDPRVREREDGLRGVGIGEQRAFTSSLDGAGPNKRSTCHSACGIRPHGLRTPGRSGATPPRRLGCARRRLRSEPRCSGLGAYARRAR